MTDLEPTFAYIVQHKREHDGCAPTVQEIAEATGVRSTNTVWVRLRELEARGLIYVDRDRTRSIRVVCGEWRYGGVGLGD